MQTQVISERTKCKKRQCTIINFSSNQDNTKGFQQEKHNYYFFKKKQKLYFILILLDKHFKGCLWKKYTSESYEQLTFYLFFIADVQFFSYFYI